MVSWSGSSQIKWIRIQIHNTDAVSSKSCTFLYWPPLFCDTIYKKLKFPTYRVARRMYSRETSSSPQSFGRASHPMARIQTRGQISAAAGQVDNRTPEGKDTHILILVLFCLKICSSEMKRKVGHLDPRVYTKKACKTFFIWVYLWPFTWIFASLFL